MSGNFDIDLGSMFQEGFGLFDSEGEGTLADSMKSAKKSKKVLKPKKTIRDFRNDLLQYKNTMSQDKEIDKVVADFASGYDAKDDKLDLLGWDILNSERISRKYVSLEDITHLSERPNTLRRAIFKRSFLKFITDGVTEFCALQGDELIEYLLDEVFSNPNLLKKNCYVKRSDGSVGAAYEEWDHCRASSTPDALRAKFQALVGGDTSTSIISYYASHGVKLDVDELRESFNKAVKEQCTRVCESGVGGFVQTKIIDKLKTLRRILDTLNKENRLGIYVGLAGTGKAMPKDTLIPTPDGEKLLGEIKVGDFVFDRKGHPTKVLGVYDRGVRRCFELTFSDGRKTRCCDEHIWPCYTSKKNLKNLTLQEMMEKGIRISAKSGARFRMPINGCVEFSEKELPVHPYILGVFLGDGCCKERYLTLSSNDLPVVEKVAKLLNATAEKLSENNYSWRFMKGGKAITTKEVFGDIASWVMRGSNEKAIPAYYLHGSSDQRIALLQGLFDTDGSVSSKSNGLASFSTTSSELYAGVSYLLRSLGLSASTSSKAVCRGRVKQNGTCSTDYVVRTHLKPDQFDVCFSLPRQIEKLKAVFGAFKRPSKCTERVALTDVREIEPCDQVCILVDNPEHLFLANDFLVTHNTHRAIEDWFVPSFNGGKNLMVSLSTLVALNGARRANTQGYSTTPCSIAMYNLCANTNRMKSWVSAYNVYCIDELSQWGLEQLDTFISIAQMALESGASFVCMGDISQIGSFLGRGNLLYMLMQNYPVTKLTENHRASSNDLIDFVWNVAGTRSRNFTRFRVDDAGLEEYVHRTPEDGEMVVTGSNACAGLINMLRMESALKEDEHDMLPIFYMPKRGDWNYFEMWRDNETWIRDRMSKRAIRVRPLENFKFGEGSSPSLEITYSKKFLRNESCLAIMDGWDVLIKSQMLPRDISSSSKGDALEMKSARISWGDFIGHFAPNYATTVNKAQGLEWKKVMVVYGDVGQIDPRQGEYVPSKNYNLNSKSASQATYVAVSRANDSLEIYTAGQQYGTQDAPMFADHMDCLKDFNGADPVKN